MKISERFLYAMLAIVVSFWGLNVVMVKYLTALPPLYVSTLRMVLAGVCFLPVLLKYRKRKLVKAEWLLVAGVGASSIAMHQITLAIGVEYTTAGNASLILSLNPLVTSLLAMLFLGEPMTWRKAAGIAIGFSGVLLVVLSQHGNVELEGIGDAIMFVSMLMYVTGGILIRKLVMRGVPVMQVTAWAQVFGVVFLSLAALLNHPLSYYAAVEISGTQWGVMFVSAVFASALGTLGWNYGIRQLGASRTAIFLNGMPLASLLSAALFLGEPLKLVHLLAFVMIVTGVYLGSRQLPGQTPASALQRDTTTKA